jgi:YD repeat-containing protein
LGNRRTQTDAEGQVTRYQYDSLNRLTAVTANYVDGGPSDAETNVTTSYAYNALGQRTAVTDPRSKVTHYTYGCISMSRGRTLKFARANG